MSRSAHGRVDRRPEQNFVEPLQRLQIVGRRLAGAAIGDDFEGDLLAFVEIDETGALHRADMDEDVLAASSG